ncbi:hypothetical protein BD289DRAFT_440946 [Coniella lustricola]|uniref:Uncharacterized protein n=1 Tax=Coniella lustricola TaxID=2025994 RepID=A0A2T3A062_9PEZI|nr:hypothetical protein BD289DRAFT_440946 [Coniella lustricola]
MSSSGSFHQRNRQAQPELGACSSNISRFLKVDFILWAKALLYKHQHQHHGENSSESHVHWPCP